jgi:hypothetical protein
MGRIVLLVALMLVAPTRAEASLDMSVEASNPLVTVGGSVTFDVFVVDLDVLAPSDLAFPPLGEFFVRMRFDREILSFVNYDLGPSLGNIDLDNAVDLSPGLLPPDPDPQNTKVDIRERSFLSTSELTALQPDVSKVFLFEVEFSAIAVGETDVRNTSVDLFDSQGTPFSTSVSESIASIQVVPNVVIPEPTTFIVWSLLSLTCAGGMWWRRWRTV